MNDQMQSKPGTGRGLRIALFVSLALNLAVIGVFAGAVLDNRGRIGPGGPNMRAAMDAGIGPFGHALTRAQRREFGREFDGRQDELRANRGQIREHVETVLSAIAARPFDAEALRQAFDQAHYALGERQRIGQDVLMGRIAAMSDAERAEFAENLAKSFRGIRGH